MAFVDGVVLTAAQLNLAFTQKGDVTYIDTRDNVVQAYCVQRANHTGTQSVSTITGLATVATSGAYNDLSGKPTLGSIASQNVSAVAITGGTINSTSVGASVAASGRFTTVLTTGAATLASLTTASATITGGTIDGAPIGATTPSTGAFTSATIGGGEINSTAVGNTTPSTGAFTTLSSSGLATLNSLSTASATVTGGTINGTVIGGTTRAAGSFTTVNSNAGFLTSGVAGNGYTTGAGGTVTQLTSKSTAVTLNKPSGRIVMNNANLAANGQVAFTLNNSLIAEDDFPAVSVKSGATPLTYAAFIGAVHNGSCDVVLRNFSGSGQSDAVVLNFILIKGSST